jgi:hypothetical protein
MSDPRPERCKAEVEHRDTLRVSRGSGFRMHYTTARCARLAKAGGFCTQHAKLHARWPNLPRIHREARGSLAQA